MQRYVDYALLSLFYRSTLGSDSEMAAVRCGIGW